MKKDIRKKFINIFNNNKKLFHLYSVTREQI